MKVLTMRLKNVLSNIIHLLQTAFVPNRSITDNCIINHELMFYLKSKKDKTGFMTLKIDMAKAYDHVE